MTPSQVVFLPGAIGSCHFWQPVADLQCHPARKLLLGWPGFATAPRDPRITGIDGLVGMVVATLDRPTALVAQSMGGVIAMLAVLAKPERITHLVLTATSGGIDLSRSGAQEWQSEFLEENPTFPDWFATYHEDLSLVLPQIAVPTLLLWGDADPISPVGVGRTLASLLPTSAMHVIPGGGHDLAVTRAAEIAPLIDAHLWSSPLSLARS